MAFAQTASKTIHTLLCSLTTFVAKSWLMCRGWFSFWTGTLTTLWQKLLSVSWCVLTATKLERGVDC